MQKWPKIAYFTKNYLKMLLLYTLNLAFNHPIIKTNTILEKYELIYYHYTIKNQIFKKIGPLR